MTVCWTSTDFLLQWMWVALIVVCAVILAVRHFRKSWLRVRNARSPQCADCPIADTCVKDDARVSEWTATVDAVADGRRYHSSCTSCDSLCSRSVDDMRLVILPL